MPNAHRMNTIMSNSSPNGKNSSLTFESVVCSQLELKRRAASFSRRRSTMCRRPSIYISQTGSTSNQSARTSTPTSSINSRISTSIISDDPTQLLKTKTSSNDYNKNSRTSSSSNSIVVNGLESIPERPSLASMFYWDGSSSRNPVIKNVYKYEIFFFFANNT